VGYVYSGWGDLNWTKSESCGRCDRSQDTMAGYRGHMEEPCDALVEAISDGSLYLGVFPTRQSSFCGEGNRWGRR